MPVFSPTKLYQASFRGVKFGFISGTVAGGRRVTVHEFLNQNTRFVEDLGQIPETFSITARIFGTAGAITGSDYKTQRDNFIAALNQEGEGELVHPFFGSVQVTAEPYTSNHSFANINVETFEIVFHKSEAPKFPQFSGNNLSVIAKFQNQITNLINTDFVDKFGVTRSIRTNYQDATSLLGALTNTFDEVARLFGSDPETNAAYQRELREFEDDIAPLVDDPNELGDRLTLLFTLAGQLGSTPRDQFEILRFFYGFGDDDIVIPDTTAGRSERIQNRSAINGLVNLVSLVKSYLAASRIDYVSDQDLRNIIEILENQFYNAVDSSIYSEEVKSQIEDIRVIARQFFDALSITLPKIATVETNAIPTLVFNYSLYGNVESYNDFIELNNIINPERISGVVQYLSEQS